MSQYQRLPTSDTAAPDEDEQELSLANPYPRRTLAEFNRPAPAWWQRAALLFGIVFLSWFAIRMGRGASKAGPEVVYATRYSDEFKYRPAASPVITEYLKDGRIRLRGATPGGVGVREGDLPLTPAQKAAKAAKAREDAEKRALEQFKESKRKAKERRMKRNKSKKGRGGEP